MSRWKHWCPNGCGKKLEFKFRYNHYGIYQCESCLRLFYLTKLTDKKHMRKMRPYSEIKGDDE
jgi:hypothetical protein